MSKQKISFTVPQNHISQVDEIAERRKRSRSFIIAEAIEKYLENGYAKPTEPTTKKKAGAR
jgi:metal-responsive CopG/Arc/MetJ family transcriptional regulator